jgi:nucleoside-diphosphate-sugar epimerase
LSNVADCLIVGCGYLGQVVAKKWLAHGRCIAALTRNKPDLLQKHGLIPIVGDVTNPKSLELPQFETVLYAVGMDRSTGKSMRDVYVDGLANVVKSLPRPKRFIYVSSTSVYGHINGEWVDESSPTEPIEESGKIVLEAERVLRDALPDSIVLRFAGIYGPERVIRRAAVERGEPASGDGDKWLNLIHVSDGANAVLLAEAKAKPGSTYIVCDDRPSTRREFYGHMAELLNAPKPEFTGVSAGREGNRRLSNRKIVDELGFAPEFPTHREGLRNAIDFSQR